MDHHTMASADHEEMPTVEPEKKKRKRLKRLCAQIREQMEFYFGDANLSKDRFLKQEMDTDPDRYVSLEIFLNFNKMKALTDDVNLIAKALSTSELLSVSSDGLKVKRVTPVMVRENVDDCTVYVEGLPITADHEWVKGHFSKFGEVLYVSLPKYKSSGDIKGFAFVEFDSEESAMRACQNSTDDVGQEGMGKFPKINKQIKQLQKKVAVQKTTEDEPGSQSEINKGKRKVSETNLENVGSEDNEVPAKKKRTESEQSETELSHDAATAGDRSGKTGDNVHSDKENADHAESHTRKKDGVTKDNDTGGSRKTESCIKDNVKAEKRKLSDVGTEDSKECKRVRINEEVQVKETERHKHKRTRQRHRSSSLSDVGKDVPQLRVIPKAEWLKLKSEYLALQKKSMRQLKSSLKNPPRKNRQHNDNKKDNSSKDLTFMPNVIVKVEVDKPTTRKDIKERLAGTGDIAYIDFPDGECSGHIRCGGPEVASRVAVANIKGHTLSILQGDEEQKYWSKILADRQKKRSSKQRTKKRGTEKICQKVEKLNSDANQRRHIVFDD